MTCNKAFSLGILAILVVFLNGCLGWTPPSYSVKRGRGPMAPPPERKVFIGQDGGRFVQLEPGVAGLRVGKFLNFSRSFSVRLLMPPTFQICLDCDPNRKPAPGEGTWVTAYEFILPTNAISGWFRCAGDRYYEVSFAYIGRGQIIPDYAYVDPVFHTEGRRCGAAHSDWCYYFDM